MFPDRTAKAVPLTSSRLLLCISLAVYLSGVRKIIDGPHKYSTEQQLLMSSPNYHIDKRFTVCFSIHSACFVSPQKITSIFVFFFFFFWYRTLTTYYASSLSLRLIRWSINYTNRFISVLSSLTKLLHLYCFMLFSTTSRLIAFHSLIFVRFLTIAYQFITARRWPMNYAEKARRDCGRLLHCDLYRDPPRLVDWHAIAWTSRPNSRWLPPPASWTWFGEKDQRTDQATSHSVKLGRVCVNHHCLQQRLAFTVMANCYDQFVATLRWRNSYISSRKTILFTWSIALSR